MPDGSANRWRTGARRPRSSLSSTGGLGHSDRTTDGMVPEKRLAAAVIARAVVELRFLLDRQDPGDAEEAAEIVDWIAGDDCWATTLLGLDGEDLARRLTARSIVSGLGPKEARND